MLSSCAELTAGKAASDYALEDRPFGSSIADTKAEFSLKSDLFDTNHTYPLKVSLIVSERRVLLAGNMDNQQQIDEVESVIWKNPYVKEVYNYLDLADNSIIDSGKDILLDKAIKMHLIGAEGVTSSNYKVLVNNKIAYILGYAESAKERDLMIKALQKVAGLRRIVPFVIIHKKPEEK